MVRASLAGPAASDDTVRVSVSFGGPAASDEAPSRNGVTAVEEATGARKTGPVWPGIAATSLVTILTAHCKLADWYTNTIASEDDTFWSY
jgi:hypothetical protein